MRELEWEYHDDDDSLNEQNGNKKFSVRVSVYLIEFWYESQLRIESEGKLKIGILVMKFNINWHLVSFYLVHSRLWYQHPTLWLTYFKMTIKQFETNFPFPTAAAAGAKSKVIER